MTNVLQTKNLVASLAVALLLALAPVLTQKVFAACGDGVIDGTDQCDDGVGTPEDGVRNNGELCSIVAGQQTCEYCSNTCQIVVLSDVNCSIRLEKTVNPSNCIAPGGTPTYSYAVTNTGNVPLFNINLSDDRLGNISCPNTTLMAGQSMNCTRTGNPITQDTTNTGTVRGEASDNNTVIDHDSATLPICSVPNSCNASCTSEIGCGGGLTCHNGVCRNDSCRDDNDCVCDAETAAITIKKDANPNKIKEDEKKEVTYTYRVTNTGNVRLTNIQVTDDKLGNISCPQTALDPGQSMTCKAKTKLDDSTTNIGRVTGTDPNGNTVSAEDKAKVSTKDCDASIGDTVWYDENGNGKQDKGEDGIDDVKVCAEDEDGEKYCDKTNNDGFYEIEDLCEGEYKVRVNEDDIKGLTQTYDPDDKMDNKSKTKLDEGEKEDDMDFGYRGKAPSTGVSLIVKMATYISIISIFLAVILYWANKTGKLSQLDRWWTRRRVTGR